MRINPPLSAAAPIPVSATGTYTIGASDQYVRANHATVPFTVTLPAATGTGKQYVIKNIGAAVVTVARAGSDTIDGNTSLALVQYAALVVVDAASGKWDVI
jgi:hypothetical protein